MSPFEQSLFVFVDLFGTFVFAVSGATAARREGLDLFGIFIIAYITACGGGMIRDVCITAVPPVGISDVRYVACALVATVIGVRASTLVDRLRHPVIFFDAVGLGFFAVVSAHKVFLYSGNVQAAITLGTVAAVGGGVMRDVLLNRVPIILQKEIYALAALVGAAIQVTGTAQGWSFTVTPWFGALVCSAIRFLSLRFGWSLSLSPADSIRRP